ncbi:TPA: alpha/beta hydrolase [Streptococcus pneumoniae]|uniref:alpha/beta hydrolase n=1 Tax=Streptococcus pneumoniae TaxID=1313 RepID=UPI000152E3DD|nr:alpha/beta hydrolase [Streptococcus pneumoniae]EDK71748.1 carboxylesterase [Streptococcus pneumoniae SP19-BS75]MDS5041242.1 alpha/beta hydrolase [Streptococcus pneumoniae]MDS5077586.1 alpha/beta hydrolase [Streptococcus pneumoniae]MDS8525287.1 alpha/beta hydrolase [Streptococcus pneumoniae]MDS8567613.1 alpha/beta hydrolase [Streptococcus pneumoniae]
MNIKTYRTSKERLFADYIKAEKERADKKIYSLDLPEIGRLTAYLYQPEDKSRMADQPILAVFHGGGFVLGYPEQEGPYARKMAERLGCLVVVLDYKLAPEFPFPLPITSSYDFLSQFMQEKSNLGVSSEELILLGHSAGGNLVLAIEQLNQERQGLHIKQVIVNYPVLDWRQWSQDKSRLGDYCHWYLGKNFSNIHYPLASPVLAEGLNKPNIFLMVASLDPLAPQAHDFFQKNPKISYKEYEGAQHGFTHFWYQEFDAEKSAEAWEDIIRFIKEGQL